MKVKCPRCGHEWNYKGGGWYVTCSRCRKLFKNPEIKEMRTDEK
jgi:tRNA(Ile2) C34 agmatinyltransferase TiaS